MFYGGTISTREEQAFDDGRLWAMSFNIASWPKGATQTFAFTPPAGHRLRVMRLTVRAEHSPVDFLWSRFVAVSAGTPVTLYNPNEDSPPGNPQPVVLSEPTLDDPGEAVYPWTINGQEKAGSIKEALATYSVGTYKIGVGRTAFMTLTSRTDDNNNGPLDVNAALIVEKALA